MTAIPGKLKGFTPVIDVVAKELGFTTAGVYGLVWRHCQMNDRVCRASIETLAEILGVSGNTVRRHLQKLVEAGFIIDTTPDRRNAPHIYKDAGRVQIEALIEAQEVSQNDEPEIDESAEVSQNGRPVSHTGRPRSPKMGDEETETKEETIDGRAWFLTVTELCAVDLAVATKTQKDQVGQTAKILRKADVTPEQIAAFGEWWYAEDWRGKTGQPPTPAQVRSEWGKFKRAGGGERRVVRLGR